MAGKTFAERFLKKNGIDNNALVKEALTHKSASPSGHYEKLEFLGDAVLGLVISAALYERSKGPGVGDLSRIKSYLVSKEALYNIGRENGIIKKTELGRGFDRREAGRNKKIVSDVVESVTGAVYLLKGFETAREFVLGIYSKELKTAGKKRDLGDYKSELQIIVQGKSLPLPEYKMTKTTGEEHKKVFHTAVYIKGKIYGAGKGKTIKEAEQEAAKRAVKKIKKK